MMKNIGKPCAGKPHARFDEGRVAQATCLLYPETPDTIARQVTENLYDRHIKRVFLGEG